MTLVRGDKLAPPHVEEEIVPVQALGGEVIVRALTLSQRLELSLSPDEGPSRLNRVARLLAFCVLGEDRKPLFTAEQWDAFGSAHSTACYQLWDIAQRLSGFNQEEVEKNSETPS